MNITAQHWDELIASAVAPTVDVGTTTTLDPGSEATATNSGTDVAAVIDFAIPAGSTIYSGTSIPDNSVGRNGDWAFDTSVNCYVWYKSGGTWALVNSLKGATGDGNGIASITKTGTVGLVDTYTITYDDATTSTFNITNGAKGDTGDAGISVVSIIKTDTTGLVDTYTITYSNSTTSEFTVTNGDKGDTGDAATITVGTVTTLAAGSAVTVVNSGTTSAAVLDFGIPKGDKGDTGDIGIDWQGAWSAGTYTITQAVSHNGSSWIATTTTTEEPSISATDWDLIALKGTDGAGSGDISGSGVANEIAYFTAEKTIDNLPVATYPSLTELSYVKGLSSAVQTQLGGKANLSGGNTFINNQKVVGTLSTYQNATADSAGLEIFHTGTVGVLRSDYIGTSAYTPLTFQTSGTERMRIDTEGNVGIGTTNPTYKLSVSSGVVNGYYNPNTAAGKLYIGTYSNHPISFAPNDTERMTLLTNGNVGIGTTDLDGTPEVGKLTVKGTTNDGSTKILVGRDSDEANVFSIDTNGKLEVPSIKITTGAGTGKVLTSDADGDATWETPSGGTSLWTAITGTRASNTTITVATDLTAIFKKGMIVRWQESGVDKVGMISIPSTYSSPNTTITIIGDTCASIDSGTFKYSTILGAEQFIKNFAVAGNIGAVASDIANAYYATEPMRVLGADLQVGTAGTTNSTTIDINKGGTTMFTTKPTLATTVASSPTPFTADTTSALALGDRVSIDIDAIQTTNAIDLYVQLYLLPTRYLSLS